MQRLMRAAAPKRDRSAASAALRRSTELAWGRMTSGLETQPGGLPPAVQTGRGDGQEGTAGGRERHEGICGGRSRKGARVLKLGPRWGGLRVRKRT